MQFQSLQFTVCKSAFLIYSTHHSASLCDKWKHIRLADTEHDAENAPFNAEARINPIRSGLTLECLPPSSGMINDRLLSGDPGIP